jgi:hypothetical protein
MMRAKGTSMQNAPHSAQLAMIPTRFTLALRSSLLWQLVRFVVINVRMSVMILKSHNTRLPGGTARAPAARPGAPAP